MSYKQDPPFAVQVELVEGCQLRCPMCGLNGIRGKQNDFKFMELSTLESLFEQMVSNKWNPRVEFAVHGEPSLHPRLVEMIAAARRIAPKYQLMMTSNGGGFVGSEGPRAKIAAIFEAGLNVLALDDYEGVKIIPKIRAALEEPVDDMLLEHVKFYEYPSNPEGSPHARRPIKERALIFIEDIQKAQKGNHSLVNNHAGAGAPPLEEPLQERCAKPFRELTVRWDGNVAISCNDWRGEFKCGNIVKHGLMRVWHAPQLEAARRFLMVGDRTFGGVGGPCAKCDAKSYRVGLLPDKFGKVQLPKPTAKDRDLCRRALEGGPYTAPVKREWEK